MITYIETERLSPHPNNPRKNLGDLSELTESIKTRGILQNLTVVPWADAHFGEGITAEEYEGLYTVVIGHRRLEAAKLAGLTELPCVISDMDEKTQIATMLLENIQRNDLTVYEQAQGFQMMLDLGESISGIAEQTGFSESTVRRRVSLLELDPEKFEKSVARGATLTDYAELEKIKDIDRKNAVLDKIGTNNFDYALRQAIADEERDERTVLWREALNAFATEVKSREGYAQVEFYSISNEPSGICPEDADTVEYFYVIYEWGGVYLFVKPGKAEAEENSEEAKRRERLEYRKKGLSEMAKRAYELRKEFVNGVTVATAKKHRADIITFMILLIEEYDQKRTADMLGVEFDEDEDIFAANMSAAVNESPERALLFLAYGISGDSKNESYYQSWGDMPYRENDDLDKLYALLLTLGYGMSDEERQMQDGTHELYYAYEEDYLHDMEEEEIED